MSEVSRIQRAGPCGPVFPESTARYSHTPGLSTPKAGFGAVWRRINACRAPMQNSWPCPPDCVCAADCYGRAMPHTPRLYRSTHRLLALATLASLAGCSGQMAEVPSLGRRAAELADQAIPPPVIADSVVAPADAARIRGWVESASSAHRAFNALADSRRARILAARGSARGSESWAGASVALAELQAARSQTMLPLAELDRFAITESTRDAASRNPALIAAAQEAVTTIEAMLAAEDREIGALAAAIGG